MYDQVKALIEEQGNAFEKFKSSFESKLEAERKEREALELKFNRRGLPSNDNFANDNRPINSMKLKEEGELLRKLLRTGDDSEIKSMSVGSDPGGGYWVLPEFSSAMTRKIFEISPMRRYARNVTIGTDSFEEIADTNEAGAEWVGETDSRGDTDTPAIGKLKIPVFEIFAQPKVTQQLLDDANIDVGTWLVDKVSGKFARTEGAAFVAGDGISKPKGLLTYTAVATSDSTRTWGELEYVPTGAASSFKTSNPADCLIDLQSALKADYRANAVWFMNRATAGVIRKLKDGNGDYLWQRGLVAGQADSLLGHAVVLDEDMPNIGANDYPVAFGDFGQGYTVVNRLGTKLMVDPYTAKPYVRYYCYRRVGGAVTNSEAIKLLKVAAS